MDYQIKCLSALEIASKIKEGVLSARQVVEYFLERIRLYDERVGAFISLCEDYALDRADRIDTRIRKGEDPGLLAGVPIAIKDNICTRFARTTCASRMLSEYIPPYNAYVVDELEKEGAIVIGKTNLDEFAMGSSTETSFFKVTRNPWRFDCVAGGSSGGSAAAVAAGFVPLALGSDTGGSIRQPAGFCGVIGLKPTYGLVSRFGLIAYGSSLDQIGPIARTPQDIAAVMKIISGHDRNDSTSVPQEYVKRPDYLEEIKKDSDLSFKIGIPREYVREGGIDEDISSTIEDVKERLSSLGAEFVEISLPHTEYAVACYYIVATAEASSNLARYDGIHFGYRAESSQDCIDIYFSSRTEGFGAEVKRRIMLGTYALSAGYYDAYYLKALKVRTLIKKDFEEAFRKVDFILAPVAPTAAFKIGEKVNDPLQMYLSDIFTIPVNLAGLPAISLPAGFSSEGLPIGVQFIGKHFDEVGILRLAKKFCEVSDFYREVPKEF